MTDIYKCNPCRDAGFVHPLKEDGSVDYTETVSCECCKDQRELEKRERYLRMCVLPPGTANLTFETFNQRPGLEEAYEAALKLAAGGEEMRWLTLMSGPDRGKTHLAISVCRRWLERGEPARYAYVPDMLDDLRDSYDGEGEYAFRYKFSALCNVPLLVLDDLGVEKMTEWATEKLNTLVHLRDVNGLALMVTTNVSFDEKDSRGDRKIPPRIASRLQRVQPSKVCVLKPPEYRNWNNEK